MDLDKLDPAALRHFLPGIVMILAYCWSLRHPVPHTALRGVVMLMGTDWISSVWASIKLGQSPVPHAAGWMAQLDSMVPMVLGIGMGLLGATLFKCGDELRKRARKNRPYTYSRPLTWTRILRTERSHLLLHLKDGRRVLGWPEGWPDNPAQGYFFLTFPYFLGEAAEGVTQVRPFATLIPSSDVVRMDFVGRQEVESIRQVIFEPAAVFLRSAEDDEVCYE